MKERDEEKLFNDFVEFLKKNKFEVEVFKRDYKKSRDCYFSGKNIRGVAVEFETERNHADINGRLVFDNIKCFDKMTRCPITLPFPENDAQREYVMEQVKFWGSKEGFEKSNGYDYFDDKVENYPRKTNRK